MTRYRLIKRAFDGVSIEISLPSTVIRAGESSAVTLRIEGRDPSFEFGEISLKLMSPCYSMHSSSIEEINLSETTLTREFGIRSGFSNERTVDLSIPIETPPTLGSLDVQASISLRTERGTVTESSFLTILPTDHFQAIFDAVLGFGFRFADIKSIYTPTPNLKTVQRLTFSPISGQDAQDDEMFDLFIRADRDYAIASTTVEGVLADSDSEIPSITIRRPDDETVADQIRSLITESSSF